MKKLIFVLLKLVEIPLIIFAPFWVFAFVEENPQNYHWAARWALGLTLIASIITILLILCLGVYGLWKGNMKLAQWIRDKLRIIVEKGE